MDVENVFAEDPGEPVNENPAFLSFFFETVKSFFEQYGWIFLAVVLLLIFSKKFLTRYYCKWKKKRDEEAYYRNYENQKCQLTFEAMQKAREKMQRENDFKTEIYLEKVRQREEAKNLTRSEKSEGKLSGTSNSQEKSPEKPKSKSKKFLDDFNPLMGHSSGSTYRPPRRFNTRGG